MDPDELSGATAGVVGRRLTRAMQRQARSDGPAAWGAVGLPGGYPIPIPRDLEPPPERIYYDSHLVLKASNYRDRCSGLTAEILSREPDDGSIDIETSTTDESLGLASLWSAPADSWCRGDLVVAVSGEANQSSMAVEFKSSFEIEPSDSEQLIEIGYATEIDASYGAAGFRSSKGRAGVAVTAGLQGSVLSKIDELQVPYAVGTVRSFEFNQLDIEGEAVVRVPASTTPTIVCCSVVVSQETVGHVTANLTSKPRGGVVVFRSVSTVTYEIEITKEVYYWPPPGFPPRPWPGPIPWFSQ